MARIWPAFRGRLPWRWWRFLEDAERRGLLRRMGAAYQFRRARLQDRLAGRPIVDNAADLADEYQPPDQPSTMDGQVMVIGAVPVPATGRVIMVLTALEIEHEAFRGHLVDLRPVVHPSGTVFEVGLQQARYLSRTGTWRRLLKPPSGRAPAVHFRLIAAGEVVMTARNSSLDEFIRQHYNDAAAVETEGAGVARAAHLNRGLPVLVLRGISDGADSDKQSLDQAGWQRIAAGNVAYASTSLTPPLAYYTASASPSQNRPSALMTRTRPAIVSRSTETRGSRRAGREVP